MTDALTLSGFSISAAGRIRLELSDGSTEETRSEADDAALIRILALHGTLATDQLEPGARFTAHPARGAAGICFIEIGRARK